MRRILVTAWSGIALALCCGCASGPLLEGPLSPTPATQFEGEANPVFVPQADYLKVYEHSLNVLAEFGFSIYEANAYEGRMETLPRIAPGVLQCIKPGSPNTYERVLSTLQTYRHRASIIIQPAPMGGYFLHVTVLKELEDLPRPVRSTAGGATFRTDNNVERQFTVIDPTIFEANWIPRGRDFEVEQVLLCKLKYGS